MLLCLPRKYRSEDDDHAPMDYFYVGSVAEGKRRQEGTPIHQTPDRANVRHRAAPGMAEASEASEPSPGDAPRGYEAARRLPRAGEGAANAARIAYPRPRDNAFATTPTYAPQAAPSLEAAAQNAGYSSPEPRAQRAAERAVQHGAPLAEEPPEAVPDWLRIARQNHEYAGVTRPRRNPRIEAAPDPSSPPPTDMLGRPIAQREPARYQHPTPISAEEYAAAGYPEELISLHQQEESASNTAYGIGRKRHGAQLAAPPPAQQARPLPSNAARMPRQHDAPPRPAAQPPYQPGSGPDYAPPAYRNAGRAARHAPDLEPYGQVPDYPAIPEDAEEAAFFDHNPPHRQYAPRGRQTPDALYRVDGVAYPTQGYATDEDDATPYGYPAPSAMQNRRNPYQTPVAGQDPAEEDAEKPKLQIPYLGIATFVAAMLLVMLWIMQSTFVRQTEEVFTARAAAQTKLVNNHPFQYRELIEQQAASNNLHPAFVAAIVLNESSFNPSAESSVGARGLMQMMPDTAQWVFGKIGDAGEFSFDSMYDPATNVRYACWYLNYLSERFRGDPVLVAAAFHAGQTTVQNWLNDSRYSQDNQTITLEDMMDGPTKTYATRVTRAFAVYRRLYYEGGVEQLQQEASLPTADSSLPGGAA